jgi:hypothetical protein
MVGRPREAHNAILSLRLPFCLLDLFSALINYQWIYAHLSGRSRCPVGTFFADMPVA